jgi:hypothetical protein
LHRLNELRQQEEFYPAVCFFILQICGARRKVTSKSAPSIKILLSHLQIGADQGPVHMLPAGAGGALHWSRDSLLVCVA